MANPIVVHIWLDCFWKKTAVMLSWDRHPVIGAADIVLTNYYASAPAADLGLMEENHLFSLSW
jgi:hypothetical protein